MFKFAGMAATTMGLTVSAFVNTNDKAIATIPILLIPQVVLSNAIVRLDGVAETVAKVTMISFWAFDAMKAEAWAHVRADNQEYTKERLARIVALCRERGVPVFVVNQPLMTFQGSTRQGDWPVLALDAWFRGVCEELELPALHLLGLLRGYSDALARALYAAGDLFLMPSSFEPCGIGQMLAMRDGQPCLVHHVGGLRDTVLDDETGFAFSGDGLTAQAEVDLPTVFGYLRRVTGQERVHAIGCSLGGSLLYAHAALAPDPGLDRLVAIGAPLTWDRSLATRALSRVLVDQHGGRVPESFEALEALPGVGHKTASVVVSQAFGRPAFPVDTHIHRLAARWGLSNGRSVVQTERDLKRVFPEDSWGDVHLQMIYFGREYCPALRHDLATCPICGWAASKARIARERRRVRS